MPKARNDLERTVEMPNENSEIVQLLVDDFGDAMRICLDIPAAKDANGKETFPRQSVSFTSAEWDAICAEVDKARAARKLFNLPT